jgi:eukaryotic-like serine/threonine-protein kinase
MVDTSAIEPGTIIAGRYRVATKIGHGGMGAVYHVHHVHTDESLALKVLHPQVLRDASVVERFRREARAPARITSEHIARVTDADTAADLDGAPFYVMEFLRGRDLEGVLRDDGPIPPALVVDYLRQAARALDKAHAIGIVHRDLKPENLFLTHRDDGSPCIKLLDFGIARLADAKDPAMAPTQAGTPPDPAASPLSTQVGYVFGTPNYMAPEQALGQVDQIGPKTDIWAFGLVAFKLLVGHEYHTGKSNPHLYAQILTEPIVPPSVRGSTFGPDFDAWFARCVARPLPDRFASAGEAIKALAVALGFPLGDRQPSSISFPIMPSASHPDILAGGSVTARSSDPALVADRPLTQLPAGVPQPASKKMGLVIGGVVLGVVILGGGIFAIVRASSSSTQGLVASSSAATSETASSASSATTTSAVTPPSPSSSTTILPAENVSATPTATEAKHARPPSTSKATAAPPTPPAPADNKTLSKDQKKRLDALERLCSQGTYSAAECQAKRAAIHGGS